MKTTITLLLTALIAAVFISCRGSESAPTTSEGSQNQASTNPTAVPTQAPTPSPDPASTTPPTEPPPTPETNPREQPSNPAQGKEVTLFQEQTPSPEQGSKTELQQSTPPEPTPVPPQEQTAQQNNQVRALVVNLSNTQIDPEHGQDPEILPPYLHYKAFISEVDYPPIIQLLTQTLEAHWHNALGYEPEFTYNPTPINMASYETLSAFYTFNKEHPLTLRLGETNFKWPHAIGLYFRLPPINENLETDVFPPDTEHLPLTVHVFSRHTPENEDDAVITTRLTDQSIVTNVATPFYSKLPFDPRYGFTIAPPTGEPWHSILIRFKDDIPPVLNPKSIYFRESQDILKTGSHYVVLSWLVPQGE